MLPRISRVECQEADYLLFSTTDIISNTLFRTGKWEEHLLQISRMFLFEIEKPLILDIGANLGAYSIPLAKTLQAIGGKVMAFEPQRIVYYQLCANVILNRLDNYYPIYSAVGESKGEVEIPEIDYDSNANVGAFSIDKKYRELHGIEDSMKKFYTKVPLISLDNIEVEKSPALIKIDVEGYELSVLKGATNFLERTNYPPLLFEAWNFDWFTKGKEELLAYVQKLGYEITMFGTSDYIAQHPKNSVRIEFTKNSEGLINMARVK
jgi:FkbM family methyltransferase